MLRKLVPVVIGLLGLGLGAGAGVFLRPAPPPQDDVPPGEATLQAEPAAAAAPNPLYDYVRLNNQFVVPVVEAGRVSALVILSLSLEVAPGNNEAIYSREPKLRDGFLQVLFDHANAGGFRGTFTDGSNMVMLRIALREAAQRIMGTIVSDVLIVDIVRQDS